MVHSVARPELLTLTAPDGTSVRGGDQEWFRDGWQRKAGCGPTTAAVILSYLAQTHPALTPLAPEGEFLSYMETVWTYVTPGTWGLDKAESFTVGCRSFALSRRCVLDSRVLPIPRKGKGERPDLSALRHFLAWTLDRDCPVAFLNYSNGDLTNLDSWHWVPLISSAGEGVELTAVILDEGREKTIDLALWLETSLLGGAFAAVFPDRGVYDETKGES